MRSRINKNELLGEVLHPIKPVDQVDLVVDLPLLRLKDVVVSFGVFDMLHLGHLRLVQSLLEYGNHVVVFIHTDRAVMRTKGRSCIYDENMRIVMMKCLKWVDEVHLYDDVHQTVSRNPLFDNAGVLVLGEDQNNESFKNAQEYLHDKEFSVVRLKRTPNISTTSLRTNMPV